MTSFEPPRQQRRAWFKRPRPAAWRRGADTLPLDRPLDAWERLAGETGALNATACPARRRLRCLEPYYRSARFLQTTLDEQLAGERFPPSPALDAHERYAQEGWTRLAVGCLCAQRDAGARDRRTRADAALLGLEAMGQVMLNCYHQYVPEPEGAWHAVHELHAGADRMPGKSVSPGGGHAKAADPETAYRQILVMAAAGPLRLRQDEQAPVYRVLADWVRHVTIRDARGAEPKAPAVLFDPGTDEAPRQHPRDRLPGDAGMKMIDPAPLAARARRRLSEIESGDARPATSGERLAGETLRVLLGAWSGVVSRQFPRSQTSRETGLVVGLDRAWLALRDSREPQLRCRLTDRSSAGFQALVHDPPAGTVQVGELVAARGESHWTVGIVRWLRRPETALLQMGVEAIAREPRPVRLHARHDGGSPSRALLLKGNRAAHQPASLVTAALPFREHMRVDFDDSGETVTLGQLVESTGSINRFRVAPDVPAR